jgi:superfamily I DNA/RNA helicase
MMPSSEILVLSFSRAAVAEIRSRLSGFVERGAPDDLRFLNVRTFDSFATRLMVASDDGIDLSGARGVLVLIAASKSTFKLAESKNAADYDLPTVPVTA